MENRMSEPGVAWEFEVARRIATRRGSEDNNGIVWRDGRAGGKCPGSTYFGVHSETCSPGREALFDGIRCWVLLL